MKRPRISIITPSYQQAQHLEETLRSFQEQAWQYKEHIVVDGGSTDGSKEILQEHAKHLSWWVSEQDEGQSHAINKGLNKATGDVFNWVNSDDLIAPGALDRVAEAFAQDPELIVFGGRVVHRTGNDDRVFEALNDPSNEEQLFVAPVINQPATYCRMDVVKELGGVEEKLRYVMDYELWLQVLFRYGTDHMRFEPVELAIFRLHEDSKTSTAHHLFIDEIAGLLHGLCMRTGNDVLAQVLSIGHTWPDGLRPILAANEEHQAIVRTMVLHFLMKWHGVIHQRPQFQMMKAFRRSIKLQADDLSKEHRERLTTLDRQLSAPNWSMFRLKRKLASQR